MSKELSRGLNKVENSGNQNLHYDKVSRTYYLLVDGLKIVTHRQWYQLGSPAYVVSGSYEGCKGTKDRKTTE